MLPESSCIIIRYTHLAHFNIGKHNSEILERLVLPSGKILKCSQPARPTVDCLFKNVMEDGITALKIFSRTSAGAGVVGVFNSQGSHWSRSQRKYVTDLIKPPYVIGKVNLLSPFIVIPKSIPSRYDTISCQVK